NISSATFVVSNDISVSPLTWDISRIRFSKRFAILGVPLDLPEISFAAASWIGVSRMGAVRSIIAAKSVGSYKCNLAGTTDRSRHGADNGPARVSLPTHA